MNIKLWSLSEENENEFMTLVAPKGGGATIRGNTVHGEWRKQMVELSGLVELTVVGLTGADCRELELVQLCSQHRLIRPKNTRRFSVEFGTLIKCV